MPQTIYERIAAIPAVQTARNGTTLEELALLIEFNIHSTYPFDYNNTALHDFIVEYIEADHLLNGYAQPKFFNMGLSLESIDDRELISDIGRNLGLSLTTPEQRQAFRAICLNFLNNGFRPIVISLNKSDYHACVYNTGNISYSGITKVLSRLKAAELLVYRPGRYEFNKRTTIMARGEFHRLLAEIPPLKERIAKNPSLIFVKYGEANDENDLGDGRLINYKPTPQSIAIEKHLKRINKYLARASITFNKEEIPEQLLDSFMPKQRDIVRQANPAKRSLHRVFTNDFSHHGRMYGGFWIQLPEEARKYIRINNQPVVQLDFKAQHAHMLYMLKMGKPYQNSQSSADPFDPHSSITPRFEIPCQPRELVKLAFNAMINCLNFQQARGAIAFHEGLLHLGFNPPSSADESIISLDNASGLIHDIINYHTHIEDMFFDRARQFCWGMTLMNHDSNIMFNILKQAYEDNVVVLPIHDGMVVQEDKKDYLLEVAAHEYLNYFSSITLLGNATIDCNINDIKQIIKVTLP